MEEHKKGLLGWFKVIFIDTFNYKQALTDLHNYDFIRKQCVSHMNDSSYKKHNLFLNWWNNICVLVTLSKDEIEQSSGNTEIEDYYFYSRMTQINKYLTDRMLVGDIMIPHVRKIEDSYSYKLVYKPYLEVINTFWFVRNIIFYTFLIAIIVCL